MKVGDYIIKQYAKYEADIWRITGIYLGGLGQQNMLGLIPINRKLGHCGNEEVREMLCPLELCEPYLVESRP